MRTSACGAACVVALAALGAPASANLISNPGFEDTSAWSLYFTLGDDFGFSTDTAHSGTGSFRFGEAVDAAHVFQPVALVSGQEYELSFWVHNLGVGDDYLGVFILGVQIGPDNVPLLEGIVGTGLESWEQVTLNFTVPAGDFSYLSFRGADNIAGFYIDDISLTAVPTPGAGSLGGLAAIALAGRRRR